MEGLIATGDGRAEVEHGPCWLDVSFLGRRGAAAWDGRARHVVRLRVGGEKDGGACHTVLYLEWSILFCLLGLKWRDGKGRELSACGMVC
jgi:hypothetical protein